MKKISVFILLSILTFNLNAQTFSLRGEVKNQQGAAIKDAKITVTGSGSSVAHSDQYGLFLVRNSEPIVTIKVKAKGYFHQTIKPGSSTFLSLVLKDSVAVKPIIHSVEERSYDMAIGMPLNQTVTVHGAKMCAPYQPYQELHQPNFNTEGYAPFKENGFQLVKNSPLSTFSSDVDRAAYSNVRRFLNQGSLPPKDAVRIEEMINYFDYEYDDASGNHPVAVFTSMAAAPWNPKHTILHVGIQAKKVDHENIPASNLVFLIDVSGSMQAPNKLPLLKSSLNMLVDELRSEDRVAIVVYAGAAGLVLPSTSGNQKEAIKAAINALEAGGSTAGGAGIRLAYQEARKYFNKEGNNRVILASDGDFNIGVSSDAEMKTLIENERDGGIFLTVLGFGMGNYKDSKMEVLADHGNGNYAYIDNLSEARKTLVNEFGSTLYTVAKDVKIQVEFNPDVVSAYRLIGYENRLLNEEDFNDDKKDAGEMGAGHVVTALYEIIPVGVETGKSIDPLRYGSATKENYDLSRISEECAFVKLRYKQPDSDVSKKIEQAVVFKSNDISDSHPNLKWSTAIAAFGMKLRGAAYVNDFTYDAIIKLATEAQGKDPYGYRSEAIQLMHNAKRINAQSAMR